MPRIIVFDVNETLLDLRALDPHFESAFGSSAARREWFSQVLQTAMVTTLTGAYFDFSVIGKAALDMVAARRNTTLSADQRDRILSGMRSLPPHSDVPESLDRLRTAGLRLATLTNNPPKLVQAQLAHSGLDCYFASSLSVETVRRFKPAPEVYRMAATELGVEPRGIRLVAEHEWDVTGAIRAGCEAAFVARPGMVLGPLSETPDIVGPDLTSIAQQIIDIELGPMA